MKHRQQQQPLLSDDDVERYSRQIIVPGVGAAGQARLLTASAAVAGNPAGVTQTSRYLAASGIHVVTYNGHQRADCYVLAGIDEVEETTRETLLVTRPVRLAWYSIDGNAITSGCGYASAVEHFDAPPTQPDRTRGAAQPGLHAVAACDAAGAAIALLLDWSDLSDHTEVEFA